MKARNAGLWSLALAVAGAALVACTEDEEPAAGTAGRAAKARPAGAAAAAPSTVDGEVPPRSYDPVGKRDPFRSYLADMSTLQAQSTPVRKKEPTEAYALDQYRLTGLLTGTSQPKAMVEDPDGKGHVVKIGTHLGRDGGVVSRITSTGIIVTQETRELTGEKKFVNITVPLPQPELDLGGGQ